LNQCANWDWCAKEIPGSRLSASGTTSNLDEETISDIAKTEGLNPTAPCNTGVCLLNRGLLTGFVELQDAFLDYCWRLMVGMQIDKFQNSERGARNASALREKSGKYLDKLRTPVMAAATTEDIERALPYPSDNWWILDEIAWLLALGKIAGLRQKIFTREQVCQGEETIAAAKSGSLPLLAHYFSYYESAFFDSVQPLGG